MIHHISKSLSAAAVVLALSACEKSAGPETTDPNLDPLQTWSFSGSEITYRSGLAMRSRDPDGNVVSGLTVWLTDQSIDCSHEEEDLPSFRGGWIGITYPGTGLGKKAVEVIVGNWPDGPGINGNIVKQGTAFLSKADTSMEKSVSGSLDFHATAFDPGDDFGKADIKGSFTVPYCPEI